jgi:CHASE2 domain-containing sensor protein
MADLPIRRREGVAGALAIVAVASALGLEIHARTPGLDRYCRDQLLRARGPLPAPDDIAIVAIDERSIARFGRFPWPRSVLASVIDAIAAAGPKAIALDILLTDPTREREDTALAEAVKRAGNVVAAAQLVHASPSGGPAAWLLPISPIARSAAAVGHVNVLAQSDGVARQLLIRAADDEGLWLRAMALETIRVADGVPAQSVTDTGTATVAGTRVIPAKVSSPPLILGHTHAAPEIDYIGPTGAFAAATYSISDTSSTGKRQPRGLPISMC